MASTSAAKYLEQLLSFLGMVNKNIYGGILILLLIGAVITSVVLIKNGEANGKKVIFFCIPSSCVSLHFSMSFCSVR